MAPYTTEAVVLHAFDYLESSRIVKLLTRDLGLRSALARGARTFASIEQDAAAVACARENLRARGLEGTLRCADAETAAVPKQTDVVVLDPPRAGAPRACAAIAAARPRRIVYVSCDPPTLGRDLATLGAAGYRPTAVETVELFPHTSHVETIVLLSRR